MSPLYKNKHIPIWVQWDERVRGKKVRIWTVGFLDEITASGIRLRHEIWSEPSKNEPDQTWVPLDQLHRVRCMWSSKDLWEAFNHPSIPLKKSNAEIRQELRDYVGNQNWGYAQYD